MTNWNMIQVLQALQRAYITEIKDDLEWKSSHHQTHQGRERFDEPGDVGLKNRSLVSKDELFLVNRLAEVNNFFSLNWHG